MSAIRRGDEAFIITDLHFRLQVILEGQQRRVSRAYRLDNREKSVQIGLSSCWCTSASAALLFLRVLLHVESQQCSVPVMQRARAALLSFPWIALRA